MFDPGSSQCGQVSGRFIGVPLSFGAASALAAAQPWPTCPAEPFSWRSGYLIAARFLSVLRHCAHMHVLLGSLDCCQVPGCSIGFFRPAGALAAAHPGRRARLGALSWQLALPVQLK